MAIIWYMVSLSSSSSSSLLLLAPSHPPSVLLSFDRGRIKLSRYSKVTVSIETPPIMHGVHACVCACVCVCVCVCVCLCDVYLHVSRVNTGLFSWYFSWYILLSWYIHFLYLSAFFFQEGSFHSCAFYKQPVVEFSISWGWMNMVYSPHIWCCILQLKSTMHEASWITACMQRHVMDISVWEILVRADQNIQIIWSDWTDLSADILIRLDQFIWWVKEIFAMYIYSSAKQISKQVACM